MKTEIKKTADRIQIESHVKWGWRSVILNGNYDQANRHRIGVKPGFETACWAWRNGAHQIHVGDAIYARHAVSGDKERRDYTGAYLRHELAHALWTDRDIVALQKRCTKVGVPFRLVNLMEDARIEHRYRTEFGVPFEWEKYEAMPEGGSPVADFFVMLQTERGVLDGDDLGKEPKTPADFYVACCRAQTTAEVFDLAVKWMETFDDAPDEKPGDMSGEGQGVNSAGGSPDAANAASGGSSGNEESAGGAGDDGEKASGRGTVAELMDGIEPRNIDMESAVIMMTSGVDGGGEVADSDNLAAPLTTVGQPDQDNSEINVPENMRAIPNEDYPCPEGMAVRVGVGKSLAPYVLRLAAKIERRLQLSGSRPTGWVSTDSPGKRLSTRGMVSGVKEFRRKQTMRPDRHMRVNVFLDLSGSMGYMDVCGVASAVVLALGRMAHRGQIEGRCVLHGDGISIFKLRDMPRVLPYAIYNGSREGLARAFEIAAPFMAEADVNLCITDGQITDAPPNVLALKRKGIYTLGLYPGPASSGGEYLKFFNRVIVRPDPESIADVISGEFKIARSRMKRAA